jgi:hypothetical protein
VTVIIGIAGMALLAGLFTILRPRENACTGQCVGCTRDRACEKNGGSHEPLA